MSGGVDTAGWSWVSSTHTGIVLSGALDANSNAITNHAQAITDNAVLTVDGSPNSGEYARLTASGLEGRTVAEMLAAISPLTTRGDIMFRNATVSTRLAKGSDGDVLTMGASDPAWTAPSGGPTIAAGSFSGNGADNRQITVGFKCSLVFVYLGPFTGVNGILYANVAERIDAGLHLTGGSGLHGTDGFLVSQTTDGLNNGNPYTYYYWAISE